MDDSMAESDFAMDASSDFELPKKAPAVNIVSFFLCQPSLPNNNYRRRLPQRRLQLHPNPRQLPRNQPHSRRPRPQPRRQPQRSPQRRLATTRTRTPTFISTTATTACSPTRLLRRLHPRKHQRRRLPSPYKKSTTRASQQKAQTWMPTTK